MPEWENYAREAIAGVRLSEARRQEVLSEVAGFLEDTYEAELAGCATPEQARTATRAELGDAAVLQCELARIEAERAADLRARRLWLPGFYCGVLSALLLRLLVDFGPGLRAFWIPRPSQQNLVFCFSWLAMLPAVGALAALYAARSGASRAQQVLAAVFPTAVMGSLFLFFFYLHLLWDPLGALRLLSVFAVTVLSWVIAPGLALAAGALPFVFAGRRFFSPAAPECLE